ncbi:MAG: hypothetical protein ERJ68_06610 [Aphanocapsa feldmannii 277cI]|uniref:Uncharacterized protein n=1 Tax=Aphanocapsa feldmannii 277cI TaxID=2507554 RepID=A0A524RSR7_9CHRO|nr:MAG: hypothetical protein ERJ68_06610 [Aphanocapsa feldmannii 277cI]
MVRRLAVEAHYYVVRRPTAMNVGELVLESLSTGVITTDELNWIVDHQQAAVLRLGRLMDEGRIQLGCRV